MAAGASAVGVWRRGGIPEETGGPRNNAAGAAAPSPDESDEVAALRRRDASAFTALVQRHHGSLLRVARLHVASPAVAEEVVQETWLGVLQGIDRFEGRCSLKTWVFRILLNRAKTRAEREGRSIPFSSAFPEAAAGAEPAVDPRRFQGPGDPAPGHWALPVRAWHRTPEQMLLSKEVRSLLREAIAALPEGQRHVITLRDIEQWTAEDVCNVLGISETNQRVLLHRARSRVRASLEQYGDAGGAERGRRSKRAGLPDLRRDRQRLPGRSAARTRTLAGGSPSARLP